MPPRWYGKTRFESLYLQSKKPKTTNMNPLEALGQCSLDDFERIDGALTEGRPLPNHTYKKIHGLWAMSLLLVDSVCVRNQQPDRLWTLHCMSVYSNNNNKTSPSSLLQAFSVDASRPAATGLSIFVKFLLVLGKEY